MKGFTKVFYFITILYFNKFRGCKLGTLASSLESASTKPCDIRLKTIDRLIGHMDNGWKPFLNAQWQLLLEIWYHYDDKDPSRWDSELKAIHKKQNKMMMKMPHFLIAE